MSEPTLLEIYHAAAELMERNGPELHAGMCHAVDQAVRRLMPMDCAPTERGGFKVRRNSLIMAATAAMSTAYAPAKGGTWWAGNCLDPVNHARRVKALLALALEDTEAVEQIRCEIAALWEPAG